MTGVITQENKNAGLTQIPVYTVFLIGLTDMTSYRPQTSLTG
jgi:hypothetical protein